MPKRYINRLQTIDRLIRIKGTGSPSQLANKLNISERHLYDVLSLMKELGAPIAYCKSRGSYYYLNEGEFNFLFHQQKTGT